MNIFIVFVLLKMLFIKLISVSCLLLTRFGRIQCGSISIFDTPELKKTVDKLSLPYQDKLCQMTTDELAEYYGFKSEKHQVTTKDGYILTVFRINAKQDGPLKKKALLLNHGLLSPSDDFCEDQPDQALAYVMANENFDVWLTNARGNVYSRRHLSRDPDDPSSGFWDFSWDTIGMFDLPAVIDYILKETEQQKLYAIGHSQGGSTLLTLLSELPEYNNKIAAMGLMAPGTYLSHSQAFSELVKLQSHIPKNTEYYPKSILNDVLGIITRGPASEKADSALNENFGESENQRNASMVSVHLCHISVGISSNQLLHFIQGAKLNFFGKYLRSKYQMPKDFPLYRITVPTIIHYAVYDKLVNYTDVERVIPKLSGIRDLRAQKITEKYNHMDFIWGINNLNGVYKQILELFATY